MRRRTRDFIAKIIKLAVAGAILFLYMYPEYIKRPIYQHLYGKPYEKRLNVWEHDVFGDLNAEQKKSFSRKYKGTKITFFPQKSYEVVARIGVLERYDTFWEKFYHGYDENRRIYNLFSPIDLALVQGQGAYSEKFDRCFKHEYRLLWSCPDIDRKYFNNNHMIPANRTIKKGLETLHKGDIVYIKGLLVNVKVPDWDMMLTGTSHDMTHKNQFAGGLYTGMCFLVYLQKLAVNGYVYE